MSKKRIHHSIKKPGAIRSATRVPGNLPTAPLNKKQITLLSALLQIDSDECNRFDIHYRYLEGDANYYVKGNIYFSDAIEDNPNLTVEKFIEQADNYGSFWLSTWSGTDNEEYQIFQIVDDKTFEPL